MSNIVLIQPIDVSDKEFVAEQERLIRSMTDVDFTMEAIPVEHWNHDLSPWSSPAVLGTDGFDGNATKTLCKIKEVCRDPSKTYIIGGYSLAGLFALWAAHETDIFTGVAAASPSVWFPDFVDYMMTHEALADTIYLSLGDKEAKTRNATMRHVADDIYTIYKRIHAQGKCTTLEWNPGNHFNHPEERTAKAIAWTLNHINSEEL